MEILLLLHHECSYRCGDAHLRVLEWCQHYRLRWELRTILTERLMHLDPPNVTGYVSDSVGTSSGSSPDKFFYLSKSDSGFGETAAAFMDLCTDDFECGHRFEPNGLEATLQKLLTKFDQDPNSACANLVAASNIGKRALVGAPASYVLRYKLGSLLEDYQLRKFIPPVVYRLQRCSPDDTDVLAQFFKTLSAALSVPCQDDAFTSWLLYYLISYSKLWETPQPSNTTLLERFTDSTLSDGAAYRSTGQYCAFSKEDSPACNQLNVSNYKSKGIIYARDQYWNKSATIPSQASVLLLSGKLDPQTPSKYADYLLGSLDGDNKEPRMVSLARRH